MAEGRGRKGVSVRRMQAEGAISGRFRERKSEASKTVNLQKSSGFRRTC